MGYRVGAVTSVAVRWYPRRVVESSRPAGLRRGNGHPTRALGARPAYRNLVLRAPRPGLTVGGVAAIDRPAALLLASALAQLALGWYARY